MFMDQYCPHTTTCPFYQSWAKYREDYKENKRIDVIFTKGEKENLHYDCLALIALNETIIPMSDELKKKLSNPEERINCSHITLLNLLTKLDKE